jgi:hypothetical protein
MMRPLLIVVLGSLVLASGCAAPADDEGSSEETEVTASAESALTGCPPGWACVYQNTFYGGRVLRFNDAGPCQNLSSYGFNDATSSVRNRTGRRFVVYRFSDCRGESRSFGAGDSALGLGAFNDRASSIRLLASSAR